MLLRELKQYCWYYDEKLGLVLSKVSTGEKIAIDSKVAIFSLMRFLIRVSQYLGRGKRKK